MNTFAYAIWYPCDHLGNLTDCMEDIWVGEIHLELKLTLLTHMGFGICGCDQCECLQRDIPSRNIDNWIVIKVGQMV